MTPFSTRCYGKISHSQELIAFEDVTNFVLDPLTLVENV